MTLTPPPGFDLDAPTTPSATPPPAGFALDPPEQPAAAAGAPPSEDGDFVRGLKRTLPELKQLAGGTMAAVGDVTGWDGLRDKGLEIYKGGNDVVAGLTRPTDSASEAWKQVKGGNLGAGVDFLQNAAGYTSGQAIESLAAAGAGALAGSEVPVVGNIAGAVGGLVAKGAVKRQVAKQAEKLVAEQVAKGAAKDAAEAAGAKFVGDRMASEAVKKTIQRAGGAALGAGGLNTVMEVGSVYPEALEKAQGEGRELSAGEKARAVTASLGAAGLESVADMFNLGVLFRGTKDFGAAAAKEGAKEAVKRYAGRAAVAGAEGALREAGTEGAQTFLERVGAQQSLNDADAWRDYIDSAAVGAVGGVLFGGVAGFHARGEHGNPTPTRKVPEFGADPADALRAQVLQARSPKARAAAAQALFDHLKDEGRLLPPPDDQGTLQVNAEGVAGTPSQFDNAAMQREQGDVAFAQQRAGLGLTPDVNTARAAHPAAVPNVPFPGAQPGSLAAAANTLAQSAAPAPVPAPVDFAAAAQRAVAAPGNVDTGTGEVAAPKTWSREEVKAYLAGQLRTGQPGGLPKPDVMARIYGMKPTEAAVLRREVIAESKVAATQGNADVGTAERTTPAGNDDGAGAAVGAGGVASSDAAGSRPAQGELAGLGGERGGAPSASRGAAAPGPLSYDDATDQLDGDITPPSGQPFTIRDAAEKEAARHDGGRVFDVDGGFVVRTPRAAEAAAPAPRPEATPAGSPTQPVLAGDAAAAPSAATTAPAAPEAAAGVGEPASPNAAAPDGAEAVNAAAHEAATSPLNARPEPTDAQKEAGNYKKGRVRIAGLDISIENPAGSKRRPEWPALAHHYGYIKGSIGKDKDHVDVFLTEHAADTSRPVFIVDQRNEDGGFDEHKVVLGAATQAEAKRAYLANYSKGWKGAGAITQMTHDEFEGWVRDPNKTTRPASAPARKAPAPRATTPSVIDLVGRIGEGGHPEQVMQGLDDATARAVANAMGIRFSKTAKAGNIISNLGARAQPELRKAAERAFNVTATPEQKQTREVSRPARNQAADAKVARQERDADLRRREHAGVIAAKSGAVFKSEAAARKELATFPEDGQFARDDFGVAKQGDGFVLRRFSTDGGVGAMSHGWVGKDMERAKAARAAARKAMMAERGLVEDEFGNLSPAPAPAKGARLENATAPEHVTTGEQQGISVDELKQMAADWREHIDGGGDAEVTHIFDAPKAEEIVRLDKKAGITSTTEPDPKNPGKKIKVYHRDAGWMTVEEAKAKIDEWEANALKQGRDPTMRALNGDKIVLSLFDLTGSWSLPWEQAGYQVFRFDIQDESTYEDMEGVERKIGDIHNMSVEFFNDLFGSFDGNDIHAILAACPCTDFAVSGAKHFAAKDADGRTVSSVQLVNQTLAAIEYFKPAVWAIENPVGRIEELTGLPPWRLSFDPFTLGDDYTKKTLLWGRFNADLPIAPVSPNLKDGGRGGMIHSNFGGKSMKTKNARSATPEGFAYAFFQANNAIDHPLMTLANKYDRLDRDAIAAALDAGVTPAEIASLVDDPYYQDLDDDAANAALRAAAAGTNEDLNDQRAPRPEPTRGVTMADYAAALSQAKAAVERQLTKLKGDALQKRVREILEVFGQKPARSRAKDTAAVLATMDQAPMTALLTLGVDLPPSIRAAMDAKFEGRIIDAPQDDGTTAKPTAGEKGAGRKESSNQPTTEESPSERRAQRDGNVPVGLLDAAKAADARMKAASAALDAFPKGAMGLTPDAVKATPEWKAAKAESDKAFAALRDANAAVTRARKQAPTARRDDPSSILQAQDDLFQRLRSGEATVEDYKAGWEALRESRDAILAHLGTLTKAELLERAGQRYRNDKKPEVVRAAFQALEGRYGIGRSLSYTMDFSGRDSRGAAIAAQVDGTTAEDLAAFAGEVATVKQQRAEAVAGMENPQTLEDFTRLARSLGSEDKLTPEQRATFDRLRADARREQRDAEARRNAEVRQVDTGNTGMTLVETKHTKKGTDLFVVRMDDRVEREVYERLNTAAKRLGGHYSSYRGNGAIPGFTFTTRDAAERFMAVRDGNVDASAQQQARSEAKADARAETLHEKAAAVRERAEASLGRDRRQNTARQARMAAGAESDARHELAIAATMDRLADAIDAGSARMLGFVRHRTQVDLLDRMVRDAHWEHLREQGVNWEKAKEMPIEAGDLANVRLPRFQLSRGDAIRVARRLIDARGGKQIGQALAKLVDYGDEYGEAVKANPYKFVVVKGKADGTEQSLAFFAKKREAEAALARTPNPSQFVVVKMPGAGKTSSPSHDWAVALSPDLAIERKLWEPDYDKKIALNPAAAEKIMATLKVSDRGDSDVPYVWALYRERRQQLAKLGIESDFELREALREFLSLRQEPAGEDRVRKLERALIGKEVGNDFFPTPPAVVQRLVEQADIGAGMRVLEPSAGKGDIAEAVRDAADNVTVDTVELSSTLRELLEAKGFEPQAGDFLEFNPAEKYDRIVMNPPFGNDNGAAHVRHAYDLLQPGGRLVAVMGDGQRGRAQFEEWLDSVGGLSEELPEGSFRSSFRPTGVRTRVVVIDKDSQAAPLFSRPDQQTDTPEFKRWFGDSKVVDADGKPLVVYHGTSDSFDEFKHETGGKKDGGWLGQGFYFTDREEVAQRYSTDKAGDSPHVKAVYLSLQNPAYKSGLGVKDRLMFADLRGDKAKLLAETRKLQAQGHDGVIWDAGYKDAPMEYVVFDAIQIKSATGNNGEFDAGNPDIRFSRGAPAGKGMGYNKLAQAVAGWTENWTGNAPAVRTIATAAELPAAAQRAEGWQTAEGYYDEANGTVYLIAENLRDAARAERVLVHEAVGHHGIEAIVSPALWAEVATTVRKMRDSGKHADLFNEIGRRYVGANDAIFVREAVAVMAEKGVRNSVMDRVIAAVRRFLRETLRLDLRMNEAELRQLIVAAARYVREGSRPRTAPAAATAAAFSRPGLDLDKQVKVISLRGGRFGSLGTDAARRGARVRAFDWLERMRARGLRFKNEDSGFEIGLSRAGNAELKTWSARPESIAILGALPEITRNAVFARMTEPDSFDRRWATFYAPVLLDNELRIARLVAREAGNGVFAYDLQHSGVLETKSPAEAGLLEGDAPATKAGAPSVMTVAQIRDAVNADPRPEWAFSRTAGPFHSALLEAVERGQGAPRKADALAWRGWLDGAQRRGEFRQSERDWLGLDDFLNGNGTTTREQLADFIRANQVQVQDVVLGTADEAPLPRGWTARFSNEHGFWVVEDEDGEVRGEGDTRGEAVVDAQDPEADGNDREAAGASKFATYQMPGGTNYRELLLTLPVERTDVAAMRDKHQAFADRMDRGEQLSPAEQSDYDQNLAALSEHENPYLSGAGAGFFKSSHFDQPNILAHVRFNERTDADGKRVLFVEEIQSDWHQAGRKRGYGEAPSSDTRYQEARDRYDALQEERIAVLRKANSLDDGPEFEAAVAEAERLRGEMNAAQDAMLRVAREPAPNPVPDAPFKATDEWAMLAFKRMVRWAADNGFDKIAWTTGEQQAARYDISKQIKSVSWNPATQTLMAWDHADKRVLLQEAVSQERLADFIGKDVADKLVQQPLAPGHGGQAHTISGLDLKVGGEGMRAFYDKILPSAVNKWAKRFGGRVGETEVSNGEFSLREGGIAPDMLQVHSLDITPEMRDYAVAGQPLFSRPMPAPPVGLAANLGNALNSVRDVKLPANYLMGDLMGRAGGLNWWHKTVGTQFNLAEREPSFRRVFDSVQRFIDDVSFFATEAADRAPRLLPKLEGWKDIAKQPVSAEDTKAIAAPLFEGTLSWTRDEDGTVRPADDVDEAGVVWTDDELRDRFQLTDGQIDLYREFRAAADKSLTDMFIAQMVNHAGDDALDVREQAVNAGSVDEVSRILANHLRKQAQDVRGALGDLEREVESADPDLVEGIKRDIASRASKVANLDAEIEWLDEQADRFRSLRERGYAPLSRFGRHSVYVTDTEGEQVYFGLYDTAREANRASRQWAGEGRTVERGTMSEESFRLFQGITPETLELFGDMLGLSSNPDDAADQAFQQFLRLTKNNRSAMKRLIHRKGIAGYSEDVGRVLASFIYSNARLTSSTLHNGETQKALASIPREKGELKDAAIKLADYVRNPQEEAHTLRAFTFAQYLGGSIAAAMVNMTQSVTMTFPYLSQYGGAMKAAGELKVAVQDALRRTTGDPALDAAIRRGEEAGLLAPQEIHQLMAQARGAATLQSGDGTSAGTAWARAHNTMAKVGLAWGKVFSVAEAFNRRVAFIAAYRLAQQQGIRDAEAFAENAVKQTQGLYSKANKPKWARGAVGGTLFTFKQFSVAYVEMLHRMATRGGPEGRRAALLALGVMFLMSGASGIPGSDDLDDLIDGILQRLGYNTSSKQARMELFASAFGRGGAQFLERGISGLPGVPIDVAGRLGMGNLVPGTGLLLKKDDHSRDLTEIVGPVGDLAARAGQAANQAAAGELGSAALTLSPTAVRNLFKGIDMATTGMYRDTRGRKVLDTNGYEALAKAIGYQPATVARVQQAAGETQQMIAFTKGTETEIADLWAQGLFEQDPSKVREAKERLARWNATNPGTPIRIKPAQVRGRLRAMRLDKRQRLEKTAPAEIRENVRAALAG